MNFKNIVFDLGNVVVKYQPKDYLLSKFGDADTELFLYEAVFNSPQWLELDSGKIKSAAANEIFMKRAKEVGFGYEMQVLIDDWCEMLTPIKDTCKMILQLRQLGYDLYFLSNISQRGLDYLSTKTSILKLFNGGVASYEVGCLKPDVAIYNELIKRYNLDPSVSIYVDDLGANIPPAYRLGMHSYQFTDTSTLKSKLTEEGISLF